MAISRSANALQMSRIYMGTMTFAWDQVLPCFSTAPLKIGGSRLIATLSSFQASSPVSEDVAVAMCQRADGAGVTTFDSARIYSGGACEPVVGACLRDLRSKGAAPRITTKAHPSQPGGLSAAGLRGQLEASLEALGVGRVDE